MNNLQLVLNILGAEHIFVPLYINFRTDANKLYPRQLLAVVLKMCKTAREEYLAIQLNVTLLDSPNDGDSFTSPRVAEFQILNCCYS